MMIRSLESDSRPVLEAYALQCFRNEIEDTILFHAPDHLTFEDCDDVEEDVLSGADRTVSLLPDELLRNRRYMNHLIENAAGETRRLLRARQGAC
jgi:hypothetical protein